MTAERFMATERVYIDDQHFDIRKVVIQPTLQYGEVLYRPKLPTTFYIFHRGRLVDTYLTRGRARRMLPRIYRRLYPDAGKLTFERLMMCAVPEPNTGCMLWDRKWDSGNGYGKIRHEGKGWMAHRLAWHLAGKTPIPSRHVLDHKCRTRPCINPEHMEPVTVKVNTHRGRAVLFAPIVRNGDLQVA